ncbi:DUF3325 domain-containing protein [Tistrella mobilis]|uniref:DUF3325 domain-containing protein n=1 Tax=Tistrella mobilis (strain KA081020-065) TaxID=1110502 RepID=I3TK56_TISMK|nr:DUF3325 domain-containing protein [Tistrella mobilis]AFK53144.1 hypothetical protein TMO_1305 [Tistrella mobilis KA081020-065]
MSAAAFTWPACVLAWAGFLGLALAMDRHHDQVLGGRPSVLRRRIATLAGWGLLGLATAASIAGWGWSIGLAALWGVLGLSGGGLVLGLSYAPRRLPALTAVLALTMWLPAVLV